MIKLDETKTFNYRNRLDADNNTCLYYYDFPYLFVNNVPHLLSTYEALNILLKQKPIENELLGNLFDNILTNEKANLKYETHVKENEINNIIDKYFSFQLSENQKLALRKAWTSEISYVQGPPGTGKSYTITAIIVAGFLLNKKILLVSHKKAAIDIVKKMVDGILGDESILYLGFEDKSKTKDFLEKAITEADSYRLNLFRTTTSLTALEDLIGKYERNIDSTMCRYQRVYDELCNYLDLENQFYNAHEEFLYRRKIFENTYQINNIQNIKWSKDNFSYDKYIKAISKFGNLIRKPSLNRIDYLYKIKFIKHFLNKFDCDKNQLFSNSLYAEDIFRLNYAFSEVNKILTNFDKNLVNQLRLNLNSIEEQLRKLLKEYLRYYFKYNMMTKLVGVENREKRELVSAFKRMLHFQRPDILKGKMDSINYYTLTGILPLWCSELRDLGKILPMKTELFDLVIVDEASQVNISEIIPAFYRGKQFCVVGDKNQLNLDATGVGFAVSKSFEKISWQSVTSNNQEAINYNKAKQKNLLVTESSILDFITSESNDFDIPYVDLDEHYRSFPPLASFTNDTFYGGKWKIMTEDGENMKKLCFSIIKVQGTRDQNKKLVMGEVTKIDEILNDLNMGSIPKEIQPFLKYKKNDEPFTYGILSFLTQQVHEIRRIVQDKYPLLTKNNSLFVATPEEFQGNERDVMYITLGLDSTSRWGKGFYENHNRFNVATSRAKYFTYLIYAGLPANIDLIRSYLRYNGYDITHDEFNNCFEEAINPVFKQWCFDESRIESDFEWEVYKYLKKYKDKYDYIEIYNQVNACGQKRIDFVLFNTMKNVTCAIEVDGKGHFINGTSKYTDAHLVRMRTLRRAGWKVINLKYFNWWDNGWICDESNHYFKSEIERLYTDLNKTLCVT